MIFKRINTSQPLNPYFLGQGMQNLGGRRPLPKEHDKRSKIKHIICTEKYMYIKSINKYFATFITNIINEIIIGAYVYKITIFTGKKGKALGHASLPFLNLI